MTFPTALIARDPFTPGRTNSRHAGTDTSPLRSAAALYQRSGAGPGDHEVAVGVGCDRRGALRPGRVGIDQELRPHRRQRQQQPAFERLGGVAPDGSSAAVPRPAPAGCCRGHGSSSRRPRRPFRGCSIGDRGGACRRRRRRWRVSRAGAATGSAAAIRPSSERGRGSGYRDVDELRRGERPKDVRNRPTGGRRLESAGNPWRIVAAAPTSSAGCEATWRPR